MTRLSGAHISDIDAGDGRSGEDVLGGGDGGASPDQDQQAQADDAGHHAAARPATVQQLRQCRLGFGESRFSPGRSGVGGCLWGGAVGRARRVGSTSGAGGLVCSGLIACGGGDLVGLKRFGRCGRRHGGQGLADRSRDGILRLRPRLFGLRLFSLHRGAVLRSLLINGCGLFSGLVGLVLGFGIRALAISGLGLGLLILVLADGRLALGGPLRRILSVGRLALRGIVSRGSPGGLDLVSFRLISFIGFSLVGYGTGLIVHGSGGLVGLRGFGRCGRRHGGQGLADRSRDGILRLRPRLFGLRLFSLHRGAVLRGPVSGGLAGLGLLLGCLALLLR